MNDGSCIRLRPQYKHHVWSYDFVTERTAEGHAFRILNIMDEYSKECLGMVVARHIAADDVIEVLSQLFITIGIPEHIRSDNGPELTAKALRQWLKDLGVGTLFIEPGSPWENRDSSKGEIFFDESIMFAEDRDFAIKLYKEANATFAYCDEPAFILYKRDSHLYNTRDSNIKQLEAHLYLFSKYIRIYNLSKKERRALIKLIFKKALDLSYAYGKNNEFRNAISCVLKGFRYSLSSLLAC